MADAADLADNEYKLSLENAIREASLTKTELTFTGHCHWCSAPLSSEMRFCDADCRDDWQKSRYLKNGRQ